MRFGTSRRQESRSATGWSITTTEDRIPRLTISRRASSMLGFGLCLWQHNVGSQIPPYVCCRTVQRMGSTSFTYDATHGGLLTVTLPAPSGSAPVGSGTRPQTRYTYATFNARYLNSPSTFVYGPSVYRLVQISSCATQSSCNGTADETRTTIAYQTSGSP